MKVPPGMQVSPTDSSPFPLVCKLKKSLYGLKQASRQCWDDVELDSVKLFLNQQFKIKDLGTIHYFLGLEVTKCPEGYIISQQKFTNDLLAEFHCQNFPPVVTPIDTYVKLHVDMDAPLTDPITYRRIIGKLNFLLHTRPDISFCVQHLSQFIQAPQVPHMLAALHVLRYLSNAPDLETLLSSSSDVSLKAYSNSDWATCAESRRSVSDFYVTLGGSPISWKSKKQPDISLSSAEAEYRALRKVVIKVSWLVWLLGDLGLHVSDLVPIYCDNLAALHIAKNPIF
ncbi:PREDICTED: uncharacterized protein LOC109206517 [Nicotiana attenuata]|uniref:uncharacterized protein LOC109206517 n=1 Tax=Nicotiana attenuata TaxID=49451 RepID=UPI0009059BB5|nr:PREDICTED: uncharacterized protein LOC109206517 [Nicotiana attenuata]